MSSWALVIGIDAYTDWPQGTLHGAVHDALKIRKWLLAPAPAGGDVIEDQMYTLLNPMVSASGDRTERVKTTISDTCRELEVPAPMEIPTPSFSTVKRIINELGERTIGGADRCFFYFAGHGMSNPGGSLGHDDAICFSDFSPADPGNSLPTTHIFVKFLEFQFREEIFFIDACRDMPWNQGKPQWGRFGLEPTLDPIRPLAKQARLFATTPGSRAAEVGNDGHETGAFTSALLTGLAGDGAAKAYSPGSGRYVVRADTLFGYVQSKVLAMNIPGVQKPVMDTGSGGQDGKSPILAQLPADGVERVELVVSVNPNNAPLMPRARIIVSRDTKEIAAADWAQQPISFPLFPREYGVATQSAVFVQVPDPAPIELYDRSEVTLNWQPRPPGDTRRSGTPRPPTDGGRTLSPHGTIHMTSADPLAFLELVDSSGTIVAQGLGQMTATGLDPGFYRTRLSIPDRKPVSKLVEVVAGRRQDVTLEPPRPKGRVIDELLPQGTVYEWGQDNIGVSEIVGAVAAPRTVTVLGLASLFADFPELYAKRGVGHHLSTIGISGSAADAFHPSSLHVVAATDKDTGEIQHFGATITALDAGERQGLEFTPLRIRSAGQGRMALPPGQYSLRLEVGTSEIILPALIFPDAATRILLEIPEAEPSLILIHLTKPGLTHEMFRAIDLLERSAMTGQLTNAVQLIQRLQDLKWSDPIVHAVQGHVRRRMGQAAEVAVVARQMTERWPEMSDGWVLLALSTKSEATPGKESELWKRALEAGIPVVGETAAALATASKQYDLSHPHGSLLRTAVQQSIPGAFWTAWTDPGSS